MSEAYEAAIEVREAIGELNNTMKEILTVLREMNQEGLYANGLREKMMEELSAILKERNA